MIRLAWLGTIVQAMTAPQAAAGAHGRRLTSIDMGYCPDCAELRAATSPSCRHCGSAAPVTADA